MATRFELVLADDALDGGDVTAVAESVLEGVDEWHRRLNRFAPDSWVSHVNRTAALTAVRCDADLWQLLQHAEAVWVASGGAFDVTRGDGDALRLDPGARTVMFARPGVQLDFGGLAKGFAIDCAMRMLVDYGVRSAFLHGGTSSGAALGGDPEGRPWRIALGADGVPVEVRGAFSISDAGSQPDPHIESGRGRAVLRGRALVTGPSAGVADAWSTAIVVMGTVPDSLPAGYEARMY